jgi:Coenzyme PQQ synthesis protein D (PqqD)
MGMIYARYRASPDVLETRVGDEIVLVDLKTDRIYSLNGTAARIWEFVSSDRGRAEVERCMMAEFDVAATELAEAIDDIVGTMTRNGLLVPSA